MHNVWLSRSSFLLRYSASIARSVRRFHSDSNLSPTRLDIKLREYQQECIESVLSNLSEGHRRLGVSLATGSGKTVVFTHLISRVPPNRATNGDQTLILVHRRELAEQAVRHCMAIYPDKTIEVEMGKSHASGYADVTVASVASITSGDRLRKFDPSQFKLVLVDEAHHIVAKSYLEVLRHFGLLTSTAEEDGHERGEPDTGRSKQSEGDEGPALVGVSATLSRFDGLRLGKAIDRIVYHKDFVDMIGEKWLSDVMFTTIKSHVDLSKVKAPIFGDFPVGALSRAVNTDEANDITVRSWMAKAGGRKSTLVFCVDMAHVRDLCAKFNRHGIMARYITSEDRPPARAEKLDDFKAGKYPVLLNCGVFTEGTDIPNIDCVLLARPTRSRSLLVQMIGRGMRLHPGKENCHVVDMVASLETGIVTVPTLFGLDPDEVVNDASVDELKELKEKAEDANGSDIRPQGAPISKVTFTDYDSVHDLISDTSRDKHIRALSRMAWVEVDKSRYILTNRYGGFVEIEGTLDKDNTMYTIKYNEKVPYTVKKGDKKWQPFKRSREVGTASTFEGAVRAADTFIEAKKLFEPFMVKRDAPWRRKEPSDEQLKMLNSGKDPEDCLDGSSIDKGQAADMITKIRHGAKGRYNRMKIEARRVDAIESRAEERKRREQVQVGPVDN